MLDGGGQTLIRKWGRVMDGGIDQIFANWGDLPGKNPCSYNHIPNSHVLETWACLLATHNQLGILVLA